MMFILVFFILQRHFAVFNLPAPHDDALRSIVHGILEVSLLKQYLFFYSIFFFHLNIY